MLVTLIPLFDENIKVSAYSLYTQKANFLLHPNLLGSGSNDGAAQIEGFELILNMGLETLSPAKEIFVPVNEISIFFRYSFPVWPAARVFRIAVKRKYPMHTNVYRPCQSTEKNGVSICHP